MMRHSKRTDLWAEQLVGSSSVSFLPYESSAELRTTTASGDTALRRSKRYLLASQERAF
jgi:hypothetical protein